MIRNATFDFHICLRRLRRAAALWLGGGLLLLALGPWPPWSPAYGWSLVYALLLAPLAMLAWLLTLVPASSSAWSTTRGGQDRGSQAGLASRAHSGEQGRACRSGPRDCTAAAISR